MRVLYFGETKRALDPAEHNARYSSDTNIAGTYVPNMCAADRQRWKAKVIKGQDPRVEVRKSVGSTQLLLVVYPNRVVVSANGRLVFSEHEWREFQSAVVEARLELQEQGGHQ